MDVDADGLGADGMEAPVGTEAPVGMEEGAGRVEAEDGTLRVEVAVRTASGIQSAGMSGTETASVTAVVGATETGIVTAGVYVTSAEQGPVRGGGGVDPRMTPVAETADDPEAAPIAAADRQEADDPVAPAVPAVLPAAAPAGPPAVPEDGEALPPAAAAGRDVQAGPAGTDPAASVARADEAVPADGEPLGATILFGLPGERGPW